MANAPRLVVPTIASVGAQGWDATINTIVDRLIQHFDRQPTAVRRMYRQSGANPSYPETLNLVNFNATAFQGCIVYLLDPEGSEKPFAYANGSGWVYLHSGNSVTIT
jgi:hypothetical protein